MLRTPSDATPQLEGINQQDFTKIQLVEGAFPFQIGLQKRCPGKTLQQVTNKPVGGIYVFYMVHGRHYQLTDFGTGIQIDPVVVPPIDLPGLPPTSNLWFDTFSGYSTGLVSRLWGAGVWPNGVGICETLIQGYIDPFLVYAEVHTPPIEEQKPKPLPPPPTDPAVPPADPGSSGYLYPPGSIDLILHRTLAHSNNSCTGQGTQPVAGTDVVHYRPYSGAASIDDLFATSITVGGSVLFHGYRIGRNADSDIGLVVGTCPGPPWPVGTEYSIYANTGELSQDS